ncbi:MULTISPECIES: phosphotransferase [unclassified Imperialibacter]|uniref:phosphotransferase n=1 Tax=unclassified Imperialibacter TaxID=2629706 RepID=UPI0012597D6B|nr:MULTISPECIES: phosphotransferase [unclassified Imperialibacter]CAD5267013.1 Aminoglycoside phosphotransferase [Imperialibacter sp. 75]CAD5297016.1 Aminoglycoside phosphotransferase [Imperialibacter sp. 89]VVT27308.1 Aminoglycoside phosphotransferase [Imperialibacter sp. EC-SDR9]
MELSLDISRSAMLQYLQDRNWVEPYEEVLRLEKPGEGNMNVVVRVVGDTRNLILKQSRAFVNKYPQIAAPIERIGVERRFYALAASLPELRKYLPWVVGFDAKNHLMVLEDLGKGADYTFVYKKDEQMTAEELTAAVDFLKMLHGQKFDAETMSTFPDNLALRKLNHEHLFVYPYMEDNGFDLDTIQPGLQALAMTYKKDSALKQKVSALGEVYLSAGSTLLHGDYYPGSWLRVNARFKVIDPEFCFFGPAEYDLGVMLAHLRMAQQPEADIEKVVAQYGGNVNAGLAGQIEGMEVLRRIIGLAQLPLDLSLEEKEELLKLAAKKITSNA